MTIPLQGLPIAAAALDRTGAITAANDQFERLCGYVDSLPAGQRLADIVAEPDRAAVEEALNGLILLENRGPQRCSVRALRARPPSLWLAIDIARLGNQSAVPYIVCLHAISRRRRLDDPSNRRPEPRHHEANGQTSESVSRSVTFDIETWPPCLLTPSDEFRAALTAIRGWAQMADKGLLTPEQMSQALTVIGRNAASLSTLIETLVDPSRRGMDRPCATEPCSI